MVASKVWFITGASRGFGRIWAEAALDRGDRVAVTARSITAFEDLVAQYGDRVLPLKMDVTDRSAVFASVAAAHQHFGRLDVILSNAGFGIMGAVEEVSIADARANFETNVFGTLNVVQAVLPLLRAQGSGHIILVSSVAGLVAVPIAGIYEGAKYAVEGIGEALAAEVAGFGIKVTLVEPGAFATDFLSGQSLKTAAPMAIYDPVRNALMAHIDPSQQGDPRATPTAILKLVDAENPPLRLMLGTLLPMVREIYAERLRTWEAWDDVARAATGKA